VKKSSRKWEKSSLLAKEKDFETVTIGCGAKKEFFGPAG
jgi:hypothetical protein